MLLSLCCSRTPGWSALSWLLSLLLITISAVSAEEVVMKIPMNTGPEGVSNEPISISDYTDSSRLIIVGIDPSNVDLTTQYEVNRQNAFTDILAVTEPLHRSRLNIAQRDAFPNLAQMRRAGLDHIEIAESLVERRLRLRRETNAQQPTLDDRRVGLLAESFLIELPVGIDRDEFLELANSSALLVESGISMEPVSHLTADQSPLPVTEQYFTACGTPPGFQNHQWALSNFGQGVGSAQCDYGTPFQDIDIIGAWELMGGSDKASPDVVIGYIDTGVNFSISEFDPNVWVNQDAIPEELHSTLDLNQDGTVDSLELLSALGFWSQIVWYFSQQGVDSGNGFVGDIVGWNVLDQNNNPIQDFGDHGTRGAGLISAETDNSIGIAGIADGAKVMSVKISDGDTNDIAIANGVLYAASSGADVLNISFSGSEFSSVARGAFELAWELDAVIVASAGNTPSSIPNYPAAYNFSNCDCYVIGVGGTGSTGAKAPTSSFGSWVDMAAPSEKIGRFTAGGQLGWNGGTSMAAPMVSGVAALVKSKYPCLSNQEISQLIVENTSPYLSNQTFELGTGLLNAHQALLAGAGSCDDSGTLPQADLNGDGVVNVLDLLILLESWGSCDQCLADLNSDGVVNIQDLLILLEGWTTG